MSNKKRIILVLGVVAVVAIGLTLWSEFAARDNSDRLTLYGNVDIREVELAFRVPGRLAAVHFDEGDKVERGDVVAEIDAEPYREALAVAAAHAEQAEANLAKLKAGSRPQEIERARSAVHEAQAAYDNAVSDYNRQQGLAKSGASSEKILDAARARRDETAATLASAKQALALAEEGSRAEDIAAGHARGVGRQRAAGANPNPDRRYAPDGTERWHLDFAHA